MYHGSWNTVKCSFGRICVSSKIEDINLKVFHLIKGINELNPLVKPIANIDVNLMAKNIIQNKN